VEQASAFGSSGIFVIVVFGLWTRFGGAASAASALAAGTIAYVGGTWAGWETPYLASLAAALGAYLLAGALGSRAPAGALDAAPAGQ
ncbi:MAG: hypothetical protein RIR65_1254, partial [Planctomycetota bacterium]